MIIVPRSQNICLSGHFYLYFLADHSSVRPVVSDTIV